MTLSVHPRLRGELFARKGDEIGYTGSSPLTRGTPGTDYHTERGRRFIPAYAGNSRVRESLLFDSAVHPRLCGELRKFVILLVAIGGSSPLTRGTRCADEILLRPYRFIPAYAGNSGVERIINTDVAVHPRLRGELRR